MMPANYVALFRGVNVGGKNRLPMKDLAGMFTEAGCQNVKTYIQSGNIVFSTRPSVAARLPASMAGEIAKRFDIRTHILVRTREELAGVIAKNPFLRAGVAEEELHILFLADVPDSRDVERLDVDRSPPDEFIVRGREIYLRLPNGMGRTKLSNPYFDSKLHTTSTARNWRTVLKLHEMMQRG
jgi:uncharacterized protein (DUF1697 family)